MIQRFFFLPTAISGLWIAQRKPHNDARGSFTRLFCADEFSEIGLYKPIIQINHSLTKNAGTIRGLHYQHPPHAETKVVVCITGEIFDVAVDIRHGSKTFLQWHGEILSAVNQKSMVIPEGFAHGFQTLSDDCELIYLHTGKYKPEAEGGLNALDPRIGVIWPLSLHSLSDRDATYPLIDELFSGISV
jgi:dTDP-4-dehydrorhamnose 3,5-epimerase